MRRQWRWTVVVMALLVSSCAEGPTGAAREARVVMSFLTPATVRTVVVEVSGPGLSPAVVVNIPVDADSTARDTLTLSAGAGRRFVVTALDSAGVTTHRADTTITLQAGANAPLAMRLEPLSSTLGITVIFGGTRVTVADTSTRSMSVGDTVQITAAATRPNGTAIPVDSLEWGSTNPAVATVAAGLVRAVRPGETFVTVSRAGATARVRVVVTAVTVPSTSLPVTGLLAYYPLDGTGVDASGNQKNGTLYNSIAFPNRWGESARAASFDGAVGSFTAYPEILNLGQAGYAISFWFRMRNFNVWTSSFTSAGVDILVGGGGTGIGFGFDVNVQGRTALLLGDDQSFWKLLYHPGTKTDWQANRWYHANVQKSGTQYQVYIDGVLNHSVVLADATSFTKAVTLMFGGGGANSDYGVLEGAMDDIRIFGRALAIEEILLLSQDRP